MKIEHPGAHLDHMMRQTRSHHQELSSMADLKANMLLTVASVVITLAATRIAAPELRWAILVLLPFCLITIGLSAYATMPAAYTAGGGRNQPRPGDAGFNLLFFGHFSQMSYDDYSTAMEALMNDPSRTYEAQLREVYTLGLFLATKKYRALRMAYLSFITGLTTSGLVALVMTVLHNAKTAP
jgi:hypothetical protein